MPNNYFSTWIISSTNICYDHFSVWPFAKNVPILSNPDSITNFKFKSFMTRFKFFRQSKIICMSRFFSNRTMIRIWVTGFGSNRYWQGFEICLYRSFLEKCWWYCWHGRKTQVSETSYVCEFYSYVLSRKRWFSNTKKHLELHANKTNEDTLNALQNVKDYLWGDHRTQFQMQKFSCAIWDLQSWQRKNRTQIVGRCCNQEERSWKSRQACRNRERYRGTSKWYKDSWKDH